MNFLRRKHKRRGKGFWAFPPSFFQKAGLYTSVDTSNPAICGQVKTGHCRRRPRLREFYFAAASVRKSVWSFVRQLRGPHLRTCA